MPQPNMLSSYILYADAPSDLTPECAAANTPVQVRRGAVTILIVHAQSTSLPLQYGHGIQHIMIDRSVCLGPRTKTGARAKVASHKSGTCSAFRQPAP